MRKRLLLVTIIVAILAPSMIFAAGHQFSAAKAKAGEANTIVVPLDISNEAGLAAMDIPLKFSEGVTLQEVTFENTRVSYFDLKIANIDNENNTVVIGLLPQISPANRPDLEAGSGTVANLVFVIDDPNIDQIKLEAVEMKDPNHRLQFIYHTDAASGRTLSSQVPEHDLEIVVDLDNLEGAGKSDNLPTVFALNQNYPNPFNPSTVVSFDLPVASRVSITVFNVLGQKVTTIVDEEMVAGSHEKSWDATEYSSGLYFYRIQADNFTETKKMLLLK